MQRRAMTCWMLVAVAAVLCLSAAHDPVVAGFFRTAEPQGAAPGAFRHGSHLSPTWHTTDRNVQFEQHCKVCHDFEANAPVGLNAPATRCASCHFSDGSQPQGDASRLVVRGGEPTRVPRTVAYDHSSKGHRDRACSDCHAWSVGARGDFLQADVTFAMPTSLAVCADCHQHGADDPGAASQRDLHKDGGGAAWRATWDNANSCADCHKAGTPRLLDGHQRTMARAFEHASHVPASDLGPDSQGRSCSSCHEMGGDAAATGMGVQQKSCGDCHYADQGASTTRLVADAQVERMPTQFLHTTEGHRQDCSTCHPMAPGARDPEVGRMYADCTKSCHTERRVERHGAWACNDCHASSDPRAESDQASMHALAKVAVQRPRAGSRFAFANTRHPGITIGGDTVHAANQGRACSDCHRREVAGLAKAAVGRPFVHDGHLASVSATLPDDACTACHVSVADTTSAARVVAFHGESVREAETCTKQCHQSPKMTVAADTETVEVPVFSHAQHRDHACTECHVGAAGVVALREATLSGQQAFSCARCHGHKEPEKIKITGGYDTTKPNDTCRECHAPKEKPSYQKELRAQQRFQLAGDLRQFHAKGGACATCHGLEQGRPGAARTRIEVLSRLDLHASHSNVRRANGSTGDVAAVVGTDNCLSCHAWDPRRR